MTRNQRLNIIREIIETHTVSNQDELINELINKDIDVNQSTLSRDLKTLGAYKIPHANKGQVYAITSAVQMHKNAAVNIAPFESIQSINFSGNLIVLKTLPGFAQSVAYTLDAMNLEPFIGTIAGDDTIMIILRENIGHKDAFNTLSVHIPKLQTLQY